MAKVKRTFTLSLSPERAQQQFVEHVAPSLHRLGDFVRSHEEPGLIAFTDGIRDPVDFPNAQGGDYVLLRRLTAHRLKVTLRPREWEREYRSVAAQRARYAVLLTA